MSDTRDSSAGGNEDLDDTIERQMDTTGLTGIMQTLRQHKAAETIAAEVTSTDDEEDSDRPAVLPPDALP